MGSFLGHPVVYAKQRRLKWQFFTELIDSRIRLALLTINQQTLQRIRGMGGKYSLPVEGVVKSGFYYSSQIQIQGKS